MDREVYAVIYKCPKDGWSAVAVSAYTGSAAIHRVRQRKTDFCRAIKIKGRKAEYEQERIEGTCDLRDPTRPAPQAGSQEADEVFASNKQVIEDWFSCSPMHRTSQQLLDLAAVRRAPYR